MISYNYAEEEVHALNKSRCSKDEEIQFTLLLDKTCSFSSFN
jgi:hypothetical protein